MPYVLTANYLHPDSLNLDPVLKAATLHALNKVAEKGYIHDDLKAAHVGFYRTGDGDGVISRPC